MMSGVEEMLMEMFYPSLKKEIILQVIMDNALQDNVDPGVILQRCVNILINLMPGNSQKDVVQEPNLISAVLANPALEENVDKPVAGSSKHHSTMGQHCINELLAVFPDMVMDHAIFLTENECPRHLPTIIEHVLLDGYPKVIQQSVSPLKESETISELSLDKLDFSQRSKLTDEYSIQLGNDFPLISKKCINAALKTYKLNYTNVRKYLMSLTRQKNSDAFIHTRRQKRPLKMSKFTQEILAKENDAVGRQKLEEDEKAEDELSSKQGMAIECDCCYAEVAFHNMVQCGEGHLFCRSCLISYVTESVFGQGNLKLSCMAANCSSRFHRSTFAQTLPKEVLDKLDERELEECVSLANMPDLHRCPKCQIPVSVPEDQKVLSCPKCNYQSCKLCQTTWADHFGRPCEEMEKDDEKSLRTAYEERMTKAKLRECHMCRTLYEKLDGCNKITCRCGAKMCYICRQPNIAYNHFCPHPLEPGHSCVKCKRCLLWSNPQQDDDQAVQELQNLAQKEQLLLGKTVGVPDSSIAPPRKKLKQ